MFIYLDGSIEQFLIPSSKAVQLTQSKSSLTLEVKEAPYTDLKLDKVVIEIYTIANNPID